MNMLIQNTILILILVSNIQSDEDINIDTTTPIPTSEEPMEESHDVDIIGLYGGYYRNISDNSNTHFIHGIKQFARKNYYRNHHFYLEGNEGSTLDYYLRYGMSRITDEDFKYPDYHHYYHDINRTIMEKERLLSDHIVGCHPNSTYLCPENTETVCLSNGTIFCVSKISVLMPCLHNNTLNCVQSTIPCVRRCHLVADQLEGILLPCISHVVVVDVYADRNGTTISKVGGTFVLVPATEEQDRSFCITIVFDPEKP